MYDDSFGAFIAGIILIGIFAAFFWGDPITPREFHYAEKLCSSNGGLNEVNSYFASREAYCKNGAVFEFPDFAWGKPKDYIAE